MSTLPPNVDIPDALKSTVSKDSVNSPVLAVKLSKTISSATYKSPPT